MLKIRTVTNLQQGSLSPIRVKGCLCLRKWTFLNSLHKRAETAKWAPFCSIKRPGERKRAVRARWAEARQNEAAAISSSGEGDNFMVIWTSPEGFFSFSAQAHRSRWCGSSGSTLIQSCSTYLVIHLTHSLANVLSRLSCQERQLLAATGARHESCCVLLILGVCRALECGRLLTTPMWMSSHYTIRYTIPQVFSDQPYYCRKQKKPHTWGTWNLHLRVGSHDVQVMEQV